MVIILIILIIIIKYLINIIMAANTNKIESFLDLFNYLYKTFFDSLYEGINAIVNSKKRYKMYSGIFLIILFIILTGSPLIFFFLFLNK